MDDGWWWWWWWWCLYYNKILLIIWYILKVLYLHCQCSLLVWESSCNLSWPWCIAYSCSRQDKYNSLAYDRLVAHTNIVCNRDEQSPLDASACQEYHCIIITRKNIEIARNIRLLTTVCVWSSLPSSRRFIEDNDPKFGYKTALIRFGE